MPHLLKYAKNSARKFAGLAEGYLRIHEWFDGSKAVMADFLHRALRHHAEAIFLGERIFRRLVTARAASAKARNAVTILVLLTRGRCCCVRSGCDYCI